MSKHHHCHAIGCVRPVPPKLLMCPGHWRLVPEALRAEVWRAYRPGQEKDKRPSREYLAAARAAIDAVAEREGKRRSMAARLFMPSLFAPSLFGGGKGGLG